MVVVALVLIVYTYQMNRATFSWLLTFLLLLE